MAENDYYRSFIKNMRQCVTGLYLLVSTSVFCSVDGAIGDGSFCHLFCWITMSLFIEFISLHVLLSRVAEMKNRCYLENR